MRPIDADGFLDRNAEFANREFIHPKYQVTLRELVDSEPTLSPDDVRGVGEWIEDHADYKCTACGETVKDEIFYMLDPYRLPTYCPNCGARMKGVSEE